LAPISTTFFPNPSNEIFNISLNVLEQGDYSLSIIGLDGKLISTIFKGHLTQGTSDFIWNGANDSGLPLPNGIYLLRLKGEQTIITDKLILFGK